MIRGEDHLVNTIASAIDVERGNGVRDWPQDEQDLHRNGSFPSFSHRSAALRDFRRQKAARAVLVALAAEGFAVVAIEDLG